jgi:ribosome-binding factor A
MAGYRIDRVSEDIKRELAAIIRELKDPRVRDVMLTVVNVEVSSDASFAKVYVSAIDGIETAKVITTLNANNNEISDISKLASITTLKTLELSGNAITDIKALEKLTSLATLKLAENKDLEDISVFESFPTTSALDLTITDTKAAEKTEAVKALQTSHGSMKITYVKATK